MKFDGNQEGLMGEIIQEPSKTERFLDQYYKVLLVALGFVTIGVMVFFVNQSLQEAEMKQAGEKLVSATSIEDLKKIEQEFANSPMAASSSLLVAERLWNEGKKEESIAALKQFIQAHSAHQLKSITELNLANKLNVLGKPAEAEEVLNSLFKANPPRSLMPYALIEKANTNLALGKKEDAITDLKQIHESYSDFFVLARYAKDMSDRIQAQPPVLLAVQTDSSPEKPAIPSSTNLPNKP